MIRSVRYSPMILAGCGLALSLAALAGCSRPTAAPTLGNMQPGPMGSPISVPQPGDKDYPPPLAPTESVPEDYPAPADSSGAISGTMPSTTMTATGTVTATGTITP